MTKFEKVIKELRWLQFNFPWQENPENDADKMSNAIHKYTGDAIELLESQQWISVEDKLPGEHHSMFYQLYGTEKWNRAMWRTESDRVLVAIKFPDGTRTVDKGKLQDGAWRTGVSPVLPQEVTHWALWPEPPKEGDNK